jgi:glycosyltransferase involved in cell wall biosynthesis
MMQPRKRVYFIVSNIHKSLAFEWLAVGLNADCDLTFILLNATSTPLEQFLLLHKIKVKRVTYRGKRDIVPAFVKILFMMLFSRPHAVHVNLVEAQLVGLSAAWLSGINKRIYTRHTSTFHHVYQPGGIWIDRMSNYLATHIVSISQATDEVLLRMEKVTPNKVVKIHHGFVLDLFNKVSKERITQVKQKWKINGRPVIGVIARQIEWKGIQFIIPAFEKFLQDNETACLVLANASGPYHKEIKRLLESLSPDRVVLIPFEEEVPALYHLFDLFVHTPVDSLSEAFGQTYVEALAAGIPSIFTLSGIAAEFVIHERNALVVGFQDITGIYEALVRLWSDELLRNHLIENGKQDVTSQFKLESMLEALKDLYERK